MRDNITRIFQAIALISFVLIGYVFGVNNEKEKATRIRIELEDEKEKYYQMKIEKERLETVLRGKDIEDRREN